VLAFYREHRFRKTYGGSHSEFMAQPVLLTEWMLAVAEIEREVANG